MKSRYKNRLRPFSLLLVNWTGARELKNLGNVELNGLPYRLQGDAIACGFYADELLIKLLHKEYAMPVLFEQYKKLLNALSSQKKQAAQLRYFEKILLKELGYALNLKHEVENEMPLEPICYYQYIPQKGFRKDSGENNFAFLGEHLLSLREENLESEGGLKAAKRLMRMALKDLLGEREIKSRELFLKCV